MHHRVTLDQCVACYKVPKWYLHKFSILLCHSEGQSLDLASQTCQSLSRLCNLLQEEPFLQVDVLFLKLPEDSSNNRACPKLCLQPSTLCAGAKNLFTTNTKALKAHYFVISW